MDNVMWLYNFYMNNFEFEKKNNIFYPLEKVYSLVVHSDRL